MKEMKKLTFDVRVVASTGLSEEVAFHSNGSHVSSMDITPEAASELIDALCMARLSYQNKTHQINSLMSRLSSHDLDLLREWFKENK